jgi:hypothetical protein
MVSPRVGSSTWLGGSCWLTLQPHWAVSCVLHGSGIAAATVASLPQHHRELQLGNMKLHQRKQHVKSMSPPSRSQQQQLRQRIVLSPRQLCRIAWKEAYIGRAAVSGLPFKLLCTCCARRQLQSDHVPPPAHLLPDLICFLGGAYSWICPLLSLLHKLLTGTAL